MGIGAGRFRERALVEAGRYGSDPWVFVRELLQNARDAGARSARFTVDSTSGTLRVACRDDGSGMSWEHARRYLFPLYASSKEQSRADAGRFGVGFWSVLRFAPERIVVRSWPRRGEAWELLLSGDLVEAERGTPGPAGHGTEVLLERSGADPELPRHIRDAALQSARFLRGRDGGVLEVRVNGESVRAGFALPPPSASFSRRGLRGVVGLGSEARVELFAKGLRVRAAAALEDLLSTDADAATRVRFPELAAGLAPQALLDGDRLEPLLARSDVREDRALGRLVRLAQRELARLVERQLALVRPEPLAPRIAVATLALVLVAVGFLGARRLLPERGAAPAQSSTRALPAVAAPSVAPPPRPYLDLATGYRGPRASVLDREALPVALRYTPATAQPLFAALLLDDPLAGPAAGGAAGPYAGAACASGCIEVLLVAEATPGGVRLPVPTGHRIDPASLRVGEQPAALGASAAGEPLVALDPGALAVVRYRTAPAAAPRVTPRLRGVPTRLEAVVGVLSSLPPEERVGAATAWVARRVEYSTSGEVVARYRAAAGRPLLDTALDVGAGDCDIQNAVLAVLLQATGLRARLAVGYVGEAGGVRPGLHAWVEWTEAGGSFRVADASLVAAAEPLAPGVVVAAPAPLALPQPASRAAITARPAWAPAAALALGLTGLGAGLVAWRRTRSRVLLDPHHDVAKLLQGALERPDAFRQVPALFERRLVPLAAGGLVSLGEAWDLASRRRLYRSMRRSRLAREVARSGGRVVDARAAEGRIVADALGATDLDAWDALLARASASRLLSAVARALREAGEAWDVRAASGVGMPLVLDLPPRGSRARIVVLDGHEAWLGAVEACFQATPRQALFTAIDRLADVAGLGERRRAELLAPLARAAILEAGE